MDAHMSENLLWLEVLTLLFRRIDFSPQQSMFQVIFRTVQVGVQPPVLHPDGERHDQMGHMLSQCSHSQFCRARKQKSC